MEAAADCMTRPVVPRIVTIESCVETIGIGSPVSALGVGAELMRKFPPELIVTSPVKTMLPPPNNTSLLTVNPVGQLMYQLPRTKTGGGVPHDCPACGNRVYGSGGVPLVYADIICWIGSAAAVHRSVIATS